MTLKIGSVPYLNAKPLVDWFHSPDCTEDVELVYAVPSKLAVMLRSGAVDVCNCSIFEGISRPGLCVIPDISISSHGPVMSVRLFCNRPISEVRTVALDTSSLTSSALTQIILSETYHITPHYIHAPPVLDAMLESCDAGLIIGDLKLFDLHPGTMVYDLGERWQALTNLPFVYAAWQTPIEKADTSMSDLLHSARDWGVAHLGNIAQQWSDRMNLPLELCVDYFTTAMNYELNTNQMAGMRLFQTKCIQHSLIPPGPAIPVFGTQIGDFN